MENITCIELKDKEYRLPTKAIRQIKITKSYKNEDGSLNYEDMRIAGTPYIYRTSYIYDEYKNCTQVISEVLDSSMKKGKMVTKSKDKAMRKTTSVATYDKENRPLDVKSKVLEIKYKYYENGDLEKTVINPISTLIIKINTDDNLVLREEYNEDGVLVDGYYKTYCQDEDLIIIKKVENTEKQEYSRETTYMYPDAEFMDDRIIKDHITSTTKDGHTTVEDLISNEYDRMGNVKIAKRRITKDDNKPVDYMVNMIRNRKGDLVEMTMGDKNILSITQKTIPSGYRVEKTNFNIFRLDEEEGNCTYNIDKSMPSYQYHSTIYIDNSGIGAASIFIVDGPIEVTKKYHCLSTKNPSAMTSSFELTYETKLEKLNVFCDANVDINNSSYTVSYKDKNEEKELFLSITPETQELYKDIVNYIYDSHKAIAKRINDFEEYVDKIIKGEILNGGDQS